MQENEHPYINVLGKISTIEDLFKTIPPKDAEKFGLGEKGRDRFIVMLLTLSHFASAPASFPREFFIPIDEKTREDLSSDEVATMLEVALSIGLLRAGDKKDRYCPDPVLKVVERIFQNY